MGCIGRGPEFESLCARKEQGERLYGRQVMNEVTNDRWLSVDEIAAYLGIKRDTVYKWIDRKKMPAHKVGSLWKFQKEEVNQWVRSGKASDDSIGDEKPR